MEPLNLDLLEDYPAQAHAKMRRRCCLLTGASCFGVVFLILLVMLVTNVSGIYTILHHGMNGETPPSSGGLPSAIKDFDCAKGEFITVYSGVSKTSQKVYLAVPKASLGQLFIQTNLFDRGDGVCACVHSVVRLHLMWCAPHCNNLASSIVHVRV
jgi:hypothetical protein